VDLVLMHVEFFAKHLLDWPDQSRMIAEQTKRLIVGVRSKGSARRPGLLAPHLLTVRRVNLLGLVAQDRDLLFRETARQKKIPFFVKLTELLRGKLHGDPPVRSEDGTAASRSLNHVAP